MLSFFPRGVLDEILNLIESVSDFFFFLLLFYLFIYLFYSKSNIYFFNNEVPLQVGALAGYDNIISQI